MKNLQEDSIFFQNQMLDFSDEYGDQKTIELFESWLNRKMGGEWHVERGCKKIDLLVRLCDQATEKSKDQHFEYQKATNDFLYILIAEMRDL